MDLALVDFDGTITTSDTWTPFMRRAIRPSRMHWGRIALAPVAVGHRLGWVSSTAGRQAVHRVCLSGESADRVREIGREYAASELPRTVRRAALERIDWHRSRGDEVLVVSAALDAYLAPWCDAQGLAFVCSVLDVRDGQLTGRLVHGDCSGREKARRIRERCDLSRFGDVYAYGDSGEDREMIELASRKIYRGQEIARWDEVTAIDHPA